MSLNRSSDLSATVIPDLSDREIQMMERQRQASALAEAERQRKFLEIQESLRLFEQTEEYEAKQTAFEDQFFANRR